MFAFIVEYVTCLLKTHDTVMYHDGLCNMVIFVVGRTAEERLGFGWCHRDLIGSLIAPRLVVTTPSYQKHISGIICAAERERKVSRI